METASHDHLYILYNLIGKDFKIRYRNMSLGIFWSLLNPLIMVLVLTYVFTKVFPSNIPKYPLFVLIGLVPFNFFTLAWATGTNSIVDNAALVKKVRFHREVIPISVVLGNVIHFLIQLALLMLLIVLFGEGFNRHWLWLPVIFGLEVLFACGMALMFSALDVYYRDIRYVVESANLVLFWMVPIFYSIYAVPPGYVVFYELNPVAAVVHACRKVFLEQTAPPNSLLIKLTMVSFGSLIAGFLVFARMKKRFADYL
ncbi:MAG TPA: ABC transporter permease [Bryobacterales bacterium]|nr:ABC transporter permease [Bryobacterales bacterium]